MPTFDRDQTVDQTVVHVSLSLEAQVNARLLMFSHTNLLPLAIEDPIFIHD